MSMSNLPPGVSDYDIPGNRPEDIEWEKLIDKMMSDVDSPYDARKVWEAGLKSLNKIGGANHVSPI